MCLVGSFQTFYLRFIYWIHGCQLPRGACFVADWTMRHIMVKRLPTAPPIPPLTWGLPLILIPIHPFPRLAGMDQPHLEHLYGSILGYFLIDVCLS